MNTKKLRELGKDSDAVPILDSIVRKKCKNLIRGFKLLISRNENALVELKSIFEESNYGIYFQMDFPSPNILIKNTSSSNGYPGLIATIDLKSRTFIVTLESYIPCSQVKQWCSKYKFSITLDYIFDLKTKNQFSDLVDIYVYDYL